LKQAQRNEIQQTVRRNDERAMDLRQFRYYIEVTEQLSFTRAARRLRISQPTLSQQIRALEHIVGTDLLMRGPSGLVLTQAGLAFLDRARVAVREAQAAVEDARSASAGFAGHLNIACGPVAEYCILQDVLALAKKKVPKLRFRLRFLPENEQILRVLNHTSDVGFMGFFSPATDPQLKYEPLYPEHGVAMIPSKHRLAHCRRLRLRDLAEESWILPSHDQSPVIHDAFVLECQKAGFNPKIDVSADWYSRFPLVASGEGVCVGSSFLLKLRRPKIKFIPLHPVFSVEIGMITRYEKQTPQLDEFRTLVREAIALRDAQKHRAIADH
jgi:DNA-binding transcriptional LysR family regulator